MFHLLAYVIFNRHLPNKEKVEGEKTITLTESPLAIPVALLVGVAVAFGVSFLKDIITGAAFGLFTAFVTWMIMISKKEEKSRVIALLLVFFVVIFFWMAFHQNGLTLTFFARDYTVKTVDPFTFMFFDLENISFCTGIYCRILYCYWQKANTEYEVNGWCLTGCRWNCSNFPI